MTCGFLDILSTPSVQAAQAAKGSLEMWEDFSGVGMVITLAAESGGYAGVP